LPERQIRLSGGPNQDKAFLAMKALLAKDAMPRYPDHKVFHVYADASDYHLGSGIMQENLPQLHNHGKELLSIVETLKEFCSMLLRTHVYTDHHNLTYKNLTSQRVLRWRVYLEEYRPKFHYVKGPDNVIAHAFSRLPSGDSAKGEPSTTLDNPEALYAMPTDFPTLVDCFLKHPDPKTLQFPLLYRYSSHLHSVNNTPHDHSMVPTDAWPYWHDSLVHPK
jgi:RNase H-like domain found in reverse transcriptase